MTKQEILEAAKNHPAVGENIPEAEIEDAVNRYWKNIDSTATDSPEAEIDHMCEAGYFDYKD